MAAGHTAAAAVSHSSHQRGYIPADQVRSCYNWSTKIICKFIRIFLFSVLTNAVNQPLILNAGKGNNLYVYFADLICHLQFLSWNHLDEVACMVNSPHQNFEFFSSTFYLIFSFTFEVLPSAGFGLLYSVLSLLTLTTEFYCCPDSCRAPHGGSTSCRGPHGSSKSCHGPRDKSKNRGPSSRQLIDISASNYLIMAPLGAILHTVLLQLW